MSLQLLAGIGTALLLNNAFAGRALVRGLILFPFVVPTIVAILIWKWMLNDIYGIVNLFLLKIGAIYEGIAWLGSPGLAMASVIVVNVWMFFPFITIQVLARLQVIPIDLYEAARVDGAGALQRFWYVVLPELRSTILLVVFIRGLWMFNKFDTIWLLTQGGPVGRTQTLPISGLPQGFPGISTRCRRGGIGMYLHAAGGVWILVHARDATRDGPMNLTRRVLLWSLIVITISVVCFPLYWMMISSVKQYGDLFSRKFDLLPGRPSPSGTMPTCCRKPCSPAISSTA